MFPELNDDTSVVDSCLPQRSMSFLLFGTRCFLQRPEHCAFSVDVPEMRRAMFSCSPPDGGPIEH